jgi:GH25 family lysozyme M1 (1,4-beta-N-acetylmuramidase)
MVQDPDRRLNAVALGIDIYRYQTVINPRAVTGAGVKYAFVKLTDGNGAAIVRGDKQVGQMKSAGISVGGYHYAQFGDPVQQADVFTAELRRLGATQVPPALDLEAPFSPNAVARDFALRFLKRLRANGFSKVTVYMSGSFAAALRPDRWGIPGLVIWIASYGPNNGRRNPLTGGYGGRYDIHQYTSVGRVAGIAGQVDLNWSVTNFINTPVEDDMPTAAEVAKAVMGYKLAAAQPKGDVYWYLRNTYGAVIHHQTLTVAGNAAIAALTELVASGSGGGMTAEQVGDVVEARVAKALQENTVHVDIDVRGDEGEPADPATLFGLVGAPDAEDPNAEDRPMGWSVTD